MGLNLVAGALMGYFSFWTGSSIYSLVVAFLVGLALKRASPKLFNEKDSGWWFSNGGIVYIFAWLIFWLVFFNLK